eukprot:4546723-Pleurochrysis_carterae.AAC.2
MQRARLRLRVACSPVRRGGARRARRRRMALGGARSGRRARHERAGAAVVLQGRLAPAAGVDVRARGRAWRRPAAAHSYCAQPVLPLPGGGRGARGGGGNGRPARAGVVCGQPRRRPRAAGVADSHVPARRGAAQGRRPTAGGRGGGLAKAGHRYGR